ncbi:gliding motility-associated C-terminal domain-containing protein [Hyphobacterium sp. CCMP332]|nr:gliding motility-associated C-terminal domain-containing protein [Hyphobacterium sp. CCMP332]
MHIIFQIRISLFILVVFLTFGVTKAQVSVSDTGSIQQIVQSLVSEGVVVQNINLNCPSGAYGTFADTTNTLNIPNGLILTSGSIFDAPGPNDAPGSGTDNFSPGDPSLDSLILSTGANTQDACFVEFDVIPSSDTLQFNYVFSSEEYLEFVNAGFNDVFGFFISGPGISGNKNIAIIPGTVNTPVSIDNVNNVSNSAFYVDNGDGTTPALNPNLQYDGFTTVLTAKTPVIPCQTYRLKLAVADVGDGILDSGVFIEKGSLGSFGARILPKSVYTRFEYGVEGCNNGKFVFIRTIEPSFPVPLRWDLGGTAQNGIDFVDLNGNPVGDRDTIPAFVDSIELFIVPIDDTIVDPLETIVLTLFDPCDDTTSVPTGDSVTLLIRETFVYDAGPDDSVCVGEAVELNSNFLDSDSIVWSPGNSLSCNICPNPFASPQITTNYIVQVQDSVTKCLALDSVEVRVFNFPLANPVSFSDSAFTVCNGAPIAVDLNVVPDSTYNSLIYSWDSTTALVLSPDSSRTVLRTSVDRYFPFEITNEKECTSRDSILITVFPKTDIFLEDIPDLCFGDEIFIEPDLITFPEYSYSYEWIPIGSDANPEDISNPNAASSTIKPQGSGDPSYEYIVSNGVCNDAILIEFEVKEEIEVDYIYEDLGEFPLAPIEVNFENNTFLMFRYNYQWKIFNAEINVLIDSFESENLDYIFNYPGQYRIELQAKDDLFGCENSISFTEEINGVIRPNVITPNGDGFNDFFEIQAPPSQVWEISIYNRWGHKVFSSENYKNEWAAENLNSGDYFYEMRLSESDLRYKGWVKVLK